jgi:membrane protease YdiL (CAAX protease family)
MTDELIPPLEPPSPIRRIFVGPNNIRAGWSIALFFLLMALFTAVFFFPTKVILEHFKFRLDDSQPLPACAGETMAFLGVLGASMVMTRIERKPLISYGLEGTRRFRSFLSGFASGFGALTLLVGALMLSGFLSFDGQNVFGWRAILYAVAWQAVFFLVGLYEESLLRGYIQSTLSRGIGFWWSAFILSAAFGCLHLSNKGESSVGIFSAALVGFVFCISLWYLKNLWWAIGFHDAWDWAQSYFWGTADSGKISEGHLFSVHPRGNILWSGGLTGPEGSLMILFLLPIIALLMWLVWRKKTNQEAETQAATSA